jgi:uncharacterized protein (TIGR01777 family)
MRIAVTGSSGFLGTPLVSSLRADGHEVLRLVRRAPSGLDEVRWDPVAGTVDVAALSGIEAVIHLAGAGVGDHRWTEAYKRTILDSRVNGTRTISTAISQLDPGPRVLVSASAVGFYGDRGEEILTELSPPGGGFLAGVVQSWEAAAAPAAAAGIRVVHPRTGIVLSKQGGALARMSRLFRLGMGGKLGSGRQYWPWISLIDEIRALRFLINADALSGPVNLTGPAPATNATITSAIGEVLHRPTVLPVPALALKIALGEFADEVLISRRVLPRRLLDTGFAFEHTDVTAALRAEL